MPLTDVKIRNAKPQPGKFTRLYDDRGMYLEIAPSGGRWWRWKYRHAGKEKRISLGTFPEVSLKDARDRRDDARKLLKAGVDPSQNRKAEKLRHVHRVENTFGAVARAWYEKESGSWVPDYAKRVLRLLERDILPFLGERPIAEIEGPELLQMLQRIEARGVRETTRRARIHCEKIFGHGFALGKVKHNPAAGLGDALKAPQKTNFAAVTNPKQFGDLLRTIDGYEGTFTVRCALHLAPLLAVRPGELRKARWADVDLGAAEWRFTASKTNQNHIVPLSRQALEILSDLHRLTGTCEFIFPGARSAKRPMSDNAVLAAMRRMEIPADVMNGHGFRASFRTIGDEVLKFRPDLIDHQLAHMVKDPNGRAYNRTSFLPERKRMMQKWADYLDRLKAGGEVVEMPKRA